MVLVLNYLGKRISMLLRPHRIFLQEKIMELGQALFYNMSEAVLKFPTSIIQALEVDEVRQVWFMVRRPAQMLSEFERDFDARLEFYKKGKDFYMHVSGRARMVIDPEEINGTVHLPVTVRNHAATDMVLVKLKIKDIQYFPYRRREKTAQPATRTSLHQLNLFKTLQYIVKDIIPVFQSH